MNCPHCKKLLTNQMKEICLGCGAQFDEPTREKIGIYFEIREYMSAMQGVQNSHQTLINKISNKLQLLGNLFNRELKAERVEKKVKEPEAVPSQPDVIPQVQQKPAAAASEKEKKKKDSQFELAIGQKLFLIIGLITIVFGVGYFLKYSFEQGWVKPEWCVLSTYAWGLGMLFAGNQFRKKNYEAFGLNIIGGGIAVLYFGAFAAFQLYDLVGQGPSFLIMAAITVLSGILALRYNAVGLACLGIFGGFLTPLLLSTGTSNHIFLLSYILLLNAGVLWISFYRKWGVLQVLGFISTYLLYTGWFMNDYGKELFWPGVICVAGRSSFV